MRHNADRNNHPRQEPAPLSEPVLLILLAVAEEPRHGYAILKDVEELSGGRVRLSTGTLYGAVRRMLDDSWIERFEEDDAPRERSAYQLTELGHEVLLNEIARMKAITRIATLRASRSRFAEVTR